MSLDIGDTVMQKIESLALKLLMQSFLGSLASVKLKMSLGCFYSVSSSVFEAICLSEVVNLLMVRIILKNIYRAVLTLMSCTYNDVNDKLSPKSSFNVESVELIIGEIRVRNHSF